MDLANSSFTQLADAMKNPNQQDAADARLLVRFAMEPYLNAERSSAEGRPIYDEVEFITIMVPGDRDNIVVRPASQQDKDRFSRAYEHWKRTGLQAESGTPLEAWPVLNKAQVQELKFFGIRTVEALANLSDGVAGKFMGIQLLKQKAAAFLAAAAGNAPLESLQNELSKRDEQIATLTKMVEDQAKALDRLDKKRL